MSGKLFVITAPSGAGKTSLIEAVMRNDPSLKISVSYTTRAPRQGEKDGVDYHFVDEKTFRAMQKRGEFLESAEVHGNYYGTAKKVILDAIAKGEDLILDVFDRRRAARLVERGDAVVDVPDLLQPRGNRPPNQIARRLRLRPVARQVAIESKNRRSARADRGVLRVERASRRCRHQAEQQRGHRRDQPDPEPHDILRFLTEMGRGQSPANDRGDQCCAECADECSQAENNSVHRWNLLRPI